MQIIKEDRKISIKLSFSQIMALADLLITCEMRAIAKKGDQAKLLSNLIIGLEKLTCKSEIRLTLNECYFLHDLMRSCRFKVFDLTREEASILEELSVLDEIIF